MAISTAYSREENPRKRRARGAQPQRPRSSASSALFICALCALSQRPLRSSRSSSALSAFFICALCVLPSDPRDLPRLPDGQRHQERLLLGRKIGRHHHCPSISLRALCAFILRALRFHLCALCALLDPPVHERLGPRSAPPESRSQLPEQRLAVPRLLARVGQLGVGRPHVHPHRPQPLPPP